MATDFKLPELGENVKDADVLKVLVTEGQRIAKDQPVIEIETEKATVEVPSFISGTISRIHVKAGDTIKVGQAILTVEEAQADGEPKDRDNKGRAPTKAKPREPVAVTAPAPSKAQPPVAPVRPAVEPPGPAPATGSALPVFAAPSVRQFAREIGVDVKTVSGSGPSGRISVDDVKSHARETRQTGALPVAQPLAQPLPDFSKFGPVERLPMSRLRRAVAQTVGTAWSSVPHVTLFDAADITALEALRQRFKQKAQQAGGKLTITAIMLKIAAGALKAFPGANASVDMTRQEIVLKRYYHVGVAVDTERGLVAPVIRDVDRKNIIELSVEIAQIAEKARAGKLSLEDMQGASFTVTNLGSLGTGYFTPIINPPEVSILGLGRAANQAVYVDGSFQPRLMLPLSLAFDHRAIDGADGARFLSWIVQAVNEPLLLAMEG